MAGCNDSQEVGKRDFETTMNVDDHALFAGVGGSRDQDDSSLGRVGQSGEFAGVDGQGGHIEFEIAGDADARCTERAEARRIVGRAHQAEIEPPQQRLDGLRKMAPAAI